MHDRAHKEGCVYPQPLVFTLLGHQRDFFSHLLELLLCSSIYIYTYYTTKNKEESRATKFYDS